MKNKIRILVTHQVHYLKNNTCKIVLLENGVIKQTGTYDELIKSGVNFDIFAENEEEHLDKTFRSNSISEYDYKTSRFLLKLRNNIMSSYRI